jgi:APA family basic amino acid/polyamine antiporter
VGETTRHVINKAHCRVILTAPPGEMPVGPEVPPPVDGGDPTAPLEGAKPG